MPNTVKPVGQSVKQEATDELVMGQSHDLVLVVVPIVLPVEANETVNVVDQAAVRDRYTVRIAAQVSQDLLRSAEGWLGVDDPFDVFESGKMLVKGVRLSEVSEVTEEAQYTCVKGVCQSLEKQASKQTRQNFDRQEEARPTSDPSRTIDRRSSTGDDTMDMGVVMKVLSPGMEHSNDTEFRAKVFGIGADRAQCLRGRSE